MKKEQKKKKKKKEYKNNQLVVYTIGNKLSLMFRLTNSWTQQWVQQMDRWIMKVKNYFR
jgi:hypothetical protein